MTYIGFDNGVTSEGIGVIDSNQQASLYKLPVKRELSYTKEAQYINRIDYSALLELFVNLRAKAIDKPGTVLVGLERPMVNSTRFKASLSAVRALEATLIAIEEVGFSYEYVDSKAWQKELLPKGIQGSTELKKASLDVGKRLFPTLNIKKDADGLLIAEFLRRKNLPSKK
jgi:hypothetical protein